MPQIDRMFADLFYFDRSKSAGIGVHLPNPRSIVALTGSHG
jgi:hypothetical protein